jgi:hypothetical protein
VEEEGMRFAFLVSQWPGRLVLMDSPQPCRKLKKTNSENGGFLRVTAGRGDVAKTDPKGRFVYVVIR